jgi:hypothetical protein
MSDHVTDPEVGPDDTDFSEDEEQISPEELLAKLQGQGPVITKEVTYLGLSVAVRDTEDGLGKQLVFLDGQTGTAHIFPFPNDAAKLIGAKLSSDLEVPEGLVLPD